MILLEMLSAQALKFVKSQRSQRSVLRTLIFDRNFTVQYVIIDLVVIVMLRCGIAATRIFDRFRDPNPSSPILGFPPLRILCVNL